MAAEGHVFAVAGSGAERPTASTGTSRPCRDDGDAHEFACGKYLMLPD